MHIVSYSLAFSSLVQSWDEFVELSSRGNMRPVHVYLSDFQNIDTKEDNFYAKLMEKKDDIEEPGFLFGKCDGKTLGACDVMCQYDDGGYRQ